VVSFWHTSHLPTSMSRCASYWSRSRSLETEEAADVPLISDLAPTSPDLIALAALNCMTQSINLDENSDIKGRRRAINMHESNGHMGQAHCEPENRTGESSIFNTSDSDMPATCITSRG
jgi:hypothetical protein